LERWGDAGKVRRNLGTPLEVPNPTNRASLDLLHDNNNTGNTTTAFWASMYDRSSIEIHVPYHASLNASETVEDITNSCVRSMERAIQDDSDDHPNGKIIQGSVVAICADGAPVELYLCLKAEMEAKGVFDWENVMWVSGAFHLLINSLRSLNGRHSQEVFSYFCSKWRQTQGHLDWALKCPDPRDIYWELYEYFVAMVRNATDSVKIQTMQDASSYSKQAHEHMLQRAVEYPVVMLILIHLKFTAIIIMLQDSWRSGDHGDVAMHLTSMRYLIWLEAITNAYKYL
jgi:hypothetical protein